KKTEGLTPTFPISSYIDNGFIVDATDTLTVTMIDQAADEAKQGARAVVFGQLKLEANHDRVVVDDIRVDQVGTSTRALDVERMLLYDDANGNGLIDAGEQLLKSTTLTDAAGTLTATYADLQFAVTSGTPRYVLIAADLATDATAGATLAFQLKNSSYPTQAQGQPDPALHYVILQNENTDAQGDVVADTGFPMATDSVLIAPAVHTLTVTPADLAPAYVTPGVLDINMMRLNLAADNSTITVRSLTIFESGAGAG
ncbi:hypothetical protein GW813_13185, partial [bacterium]|nr:hypothetical protein [bacterium]